MGYTYNPGITIRSAKGIPEATRKAVGSLVAWLRRTQRVEDGLIVYLRPEPAVGDPGGGIGFAAIALPLGRPRVPGTFLWLLVGAGCVEAFKEDFAESHEEATDALLHNVLHEFAHYEQWRDGRKVQERGVNVRATNLLRQYHEAVSPSLSQRTP